MREHFPIFENTTYLNTPAVGLISDRTAQRSKDYADEHLMQAWGAREGWMEEIEATRKMLAEYVHASPMEICMISNTAEGIRYLAQTLKGERIKIALSEEDYPTINSPWELMGFELEYIHTEDNGEINLKSVAQSDADIVVISHVQWKSGFKVNLEKLNEICERTGKRIILDATQSLGPNRIDLDKLTAVDAMLVSGYKWMMAGFGGSFMYVSQQFLQKYPVKIHWRFYDEVQQLNPTARRFEIGHERFDAVLRLNESLKLMKEMGYDEIDKRTTELSRYFYAKMKEEGIAIHSDFAEENRSQIVVIEGSLAEVEALEREGIMVSHRGKGIRVGMHFYNNEEDIDRLAAALKSMKEIEL